MNAQELKALLRKSESRVGWIDLVARFFAAREIFYGHGTDRPEDEAFWLVWHLSGQPESLDSLPPDPPVADRIAALAERRVEARVPMAYLLGSAWFAGLEFEVAPGVLVPRSPLAELIEQRYSPWIDLRAGDRVLEIGTGSACIAVATAVHNPDVLVDATEIDARALELARRNIDRHRVQDRVRLIEADLFPPSPAEYRVIISNPPYVPTAEIAELPPEYGHEPVAAFDGGQDGLELVQRILAGAAGRLAPDGILIVEVGIAADALLAQYPSVPWTWIEFERGGDGVFLLTAEDLNNGWG